MPPVLALLESPYGYQPWGLPSTGLSAFLLLSARCADPVSVDEHWRSSNTTRAGLPGNDPLTELTRGI